MGGDGLLGRLSVARRERDAARREAAAAKAEAATLRRDLAALLALVAESAASQVTGVQP